MKAHGRCARPQQGSLCRIYQTSYVSYLAPAKFITNVSAVIATALADAHPGVEPTLPPMPGSPPSIDAAWAHKRRG